MRDTKLSFKQFKKSVFHKQRQQVYSPGISLSTLTPHHYHPLHPFLPDPLHLHPPKKSSVAGANTNTRHTYTHIHTLIQATLEQTSKVVLANSLITGSGWVYCSALKARQNKPISMQQKKFHTFLISVPLHFLHICIMTGSCLTIDENFLT